MKLPKTKRATDIQLRMSEESNKLILEGYAAKFDTPTVLYKINGVEYKEIIDKGAFDNCDMKDCCLKYNHEASVPLLARTRGGSLKLSIDEVGLKFHAELVDTQVSRDVYALVQAGVLDKCSFAFTISEDGDYFDKETLTRHLTKLDKLFDVAIVDIPAYEDTNVSARSFFELDYEKNKQECLQRATRKRKLKLKILLGGK